MPAAIGLEFAVEPVTQECVVVGICFEINAAAVAAITAGGPAARNEFLAAKRNAAVPAVAGLYIDFGFINKHVNSNSANEDTTPRGRIALIAFKGNLFL